MKIMPSALGSIGIGLCVLGLISKLELACISWGTPGAWWWDAFDFFSAVGVICGLDLCLAAIIWRDVARTRARKPRQPPASGPNAAAGGQASRGDIARARNWPAQAAVVLAVLAILFLSILLLVIYVINVKAIIGGLIFLFACLAIVFAGIGLARFDRTGSGGRMSVVAVVLAIAVILVAMLLLYIYTDAQRIHGHPYIDGSRTTNVAGQRLRRSTGSPSSGE